MNTIDISEFRRTDLRIARIISATPTPKSDNLLTLEVDIGEEKRQLVAGIAQHYQPDELPGKLVLVVANLKPARIRGVTSKGMLLAAEHQGKLVIISPENDIPPGAKVK